MSILTLVRSSPDPSVLPLEFLVPAIVYLVSLAVRTGYELLKESGRIGEGNKGAFAVVFVAMFAFWTCWFMLCEADPYRVGLPDPVRWAGQAVNILGTVLAVGAFLQLRGLEGIDHLVTRGLFRRMRHPMYAGFILWIVGWSVFHGAVGGMVLGVPGIASILWWRHLEDVRLEVQFRSAYREYRETTWF